ncbi:hypothetical protein GCM10010193_20220 [Kitasatospora atroaurantiaca]|uniref:DNA-binding SARP family transcriptional activator n=1 Tax=Kitasatospora atroaurantiaca TaxID=285545 RepID=A0A561EVE8_9ACTN|nr:AfsR/SARP family transcriptional regulator [Kitasatospora atroaurantiaca]TWE19583.1 DNA-binding SARP family transcriptional activator [Kitasatospora atroaurantiaca]
MEIGLLGSLSAHEQETSVVPSAAKPRQVLALLALQAGRVVTVPTLIEELWGDHPPRSATTTLQTYVLQLRRRIAEALGDRPGCSAKDILTTHHGGYLLEVQPGNIDVHEFERQAGLGRAALHAGDDRTASLLLGQALALWRGPALVDVQIGRVLEIEALRLQEARLGALEGRIGADLRLGRHTDLLSELTVLSARHPMHEGLHAQFMIAQYRAGRAWQALETYRRLRGTLDAELGLEPSPRIQQLHQSILVADPRLSHDLDAERLELDRLVG